MNVDVTILDGPLPGATPRQVEGAGAVLAFEGVVRPSEDNRPITGLTYETYDPMAERELARLGEQAIARFALLAVSVTHSRGFVPNLDCSFRLHVAAAHRAEALAAMDWYIDRLKQEVPIWKRAVFADEPIEASSASAASRREGRS